GGDRLAGFPIEQEQLTALGSLYQSRDGCTRRSRRISVARLSMDAGNSMPRKNPSPHPEQRRINARWGAQAFEVKGG
ncbi:hypothetical protein NL494_28710, partial [Klebsiella pneumoniae]|nr:hypothetical protein [Klebsiella pneumoniae]